MKLLKLGGIGTFLGGILAAIQGCSPEDSIRALMVFLVLLIPGLGGGSNLTSDELIGFATHINGYVDTFVGIEELREQASVGNIPMLIHLLSYNDLRVRWAAIYVLNGLLTKPQQLSDEMTELLASGLNYENGATIVALTAATLLHIGDTRGVSFLQQLRASNQAMGFTEPPMSIGSFASLVLSDYGISSTTKEPMQQASTGVSNINRTPAVQLPEATLIPDSTDELVVTIQIEVDEKVPTPHLLEAWKQQIEDVWNNQDFKYSGDCTVRFEAKLVSRSKAPSVDYHRIKAISQDDYFVSHIDKLPEPGDHRWQSTSGKWWAKIQGLIPPEQSLMPAHEAGHLMGLDDEYHYEWLDTAPIEKRILESPDKYADHPEWVQCVDVNEDSIMGCTIDGKDEVLQRHIDQIIQIKGGVGASCEQSQFTLTVNVDGSGSGTVTSEPVGINCGSTCLANFNSGQAITLTQTADSDSTFAGWSGDCNSSGQVTMDAPKTCTATFDKKPVSNLCDDPAIFGCWTFDEDKGSTAWDYSGNGNHGSATIGTPTYEPGIKGLAIHVTDDRVTLPWNHSSWDAFTVEAWFYLNNMGPGSGQCTDPDGCNIWMDEELLGPGSWSHVAVWIGSLNPTTNNFDRLQFFCDDGNSSTGGYSTEFTGGVAQNQWHHIVMTSEKNGQTKGYYDGQFVGGWNQVGWGIPGITLHLGGRDFRDNNLLTDGLIDEVRVYQRVLTSAEISAHYAARQ